MRAADIMTPDPVTISPEADVHVASLLMEEHRVRHLPVVEGRRLVGLISERDVLEASGWAIPAGGRTCTVRESMRVPVVATSPHEDLGSVCQRLAEWRVGCLPVLDRGELEGIVTEIDVMRAYASWVESGDAPADANPPVSERMTREVVSVGPRTPLGEAIDVLREKNIRHVPLVDDGRVVGILSERDVRLCFGRGQSITVDVSVVASPRVETVAPTLALAECVATLVLGKIGALVVTEDQRLAGILTTMDVLEHCASLRW